MANFSLLHNLRLRSNKVLHCFVEVGAALSDFLKTLLHEAEAERERRNEYNAIIALMREPTELRVFNQMWVTFPVVVEDEESVPYPTGDLD